MEFMNIDSDRVIILNDFITGSFQPFSEKLKDATEIAKNGINLTLEYDLCKMHDMPKTTKINLRIHGIVACCPECLEAYNQAPKCSKWKILSQI